MDHTLQVTLLKELIRQIDENKTADAGKLSINPTSSYVSPDLAKKEWETFFKRHAQLIGLSGSLPKPGSYFTTDDFGVPVLATRGRDGQFRAFVNACRHRGVRLTEEDRGEQVKFTCPFHAWTYANTGELIGIPQADHFGDVDRSCMGLIELPAEERNGLLWVHPDPDGVLDLGPYLGDLDAEIASWNFEEMIFVSQTKIDMALNWKLANDTFGETYHFQKLHKNTLGALFHGDTLAYETFGQNHRFVFSGKGLDAVRERPEEEWTLSDGALLIYFLFPNIQFIKGNGNVSLVRLYPDGENPGRSITKIDHFFHPKTLAELQNLDSEKQFVSGENVYEFDPSEAFVLNVSAITEVFDSTVEQEDYAMGITTQKAAESGSLKTVVFGRNEPALHHFHNTFRAALGEPPLETLEETGAAAQVRTA